MQVKSVAVVAPEQPSEEEINPFLIFPQPEENFKVQSSFLVIISVMISFLLFISFACNLLLFWCKWLYWFSTTKYSFVFERRNVVVSQHHNIYAR